MAHLSPDQTAWREAVRANADAVAAEVAAAVGAAVTVGLGLDGLVVEVEGGGPGVAWRVAEQLAPLWPAGLAVTGAGLEVRVGRVAVEASAVMMVEVAERGQAAWAPVHRIG